MATVSFIGSNDAPALEMFERVFSPVRFCGMHKALLVSLAWLCTFVLIDGIPGPALGGGMLASRATYYCTFVPQGEGPDGTCQ